MAFRYALCHPPPPRRSEASTDGPWYEASLGRLRLSRHPGAGSARVTRRLVGLGRRDASCVRPVPVLCRSSAGRRGASFAPPPSVDRAGSMGKMAMQLPAKAPSIVLPFGPMLCNATAVGCCHDRAGPHGHDRRWVRAALLVRSVARQRRGHRSHPRRRAPAKPACGRRPAALPQVSGATMRRMRRAPSDCSPADGPSTRHPALARTALPTPQSWAATGANGAWFNGA